MRGMVEPPASRTALRRNLDPLSGTAVLNGIPVAVAPAD